MLKSLSKLWLRGIKRASKAQQQQNKKLASSLFGKPATSKRPAAKPSGAATAQPRAKTGAASVPLPGKWLSSYYSSFTEEGRLPARRMSYWLYLPSTATSSPLPLVVMLHGCGQTAPQFSQGTRMNQLAEREAFAVLYPQQSLRAHPGRCWPWYQKTTQEGGDEAQLIAGIIDKVAGKYALDRTRIYIAGLSAGAAMANIVALNYPHLIAAVGLHSGTIFGGGHSRMGAYAIMQGGSVKLISNAIRDIVNKFEAFPPMPAILIHGQQDKVVRPINLAQLAQQFKILNRLTDEGQKPVMLKGAGRAGSRNPANPYKTYDHYSGKTLLLRVCEILHLEHAWSGGDCSLKFNACAGPDASKMMWDFFARHRRLA